MNTQKRVFNTLFNKSYKLNKHKTQLGVSQDLVSVVENGKGIIETAQKTVDIAINVNIQLEKLTDDVRFYNDYRKISYDDINRQTSLINDLMSKAENLANELGVDPEKIEGYTNAKNYLIDLQTVSGYMQTHTLNFDI